MDAITLAEIALFGLAALFAATGGIVLLWQSAGRAASRRVGMLLLLEAALIAVGPVAGIAAIDALDARGPLVGVPLFVGSLLLAPAYLRVVATLDTPLVGFLRSRGANVALSILAAEAIVVGALAWRGVDVQDVWATIWFYQALLGMLAAAGSSMAAAVSARRRARRGTADRERATAWLLAFGLQDGMLLLAIPLQNLFTEGVAQGQFMAFWLAITVLVHVMLLLYGVLRSQLFDLDLKIKWGLRQGTLTAIFVAAFFVVDQTAQQFFSERVGAYLGIAATGVLLFAIVPLQQFAMRVAERAMPGVDATPEYVAYRKLHVYRAAVEATLTDGKVTDKARAMLARLAAELRIDPRDVILVENELSAGQGVQTA